MRNQYRNRPSCLSNLLTSLISIFLIPYAIISRISSGDHWSISITSHAVCHALNQDLPLITCITRLSWPAHRTLVSHSSRDFLTQPSGKSHIKIHINCNKDFIPDLNPVQITDFTSLPSFTLSSALIYTPINHPLPVPFRISLIILPESKGFSSSNQSKKFCNRRGCF